MGIMKSLDIVLSEYKLSDPQKNAIVEIYGGGTNPINVRTLASLEKRGLIEMRLDGWSVSDSLADEINQAVRGSEPREEVTAGEDLGEVEAELFVPKFNRKMIRDLRKGQARANRRAMYNQGKRRKMYGADDEGYFRRKAEKAYSDMVDQLRSEDAA